MTVGTTTTIDGSVLDVAESPGQQLAKLREKRGYTQEYVAGKLHLRVRVIELLETDNYELLPEPVFIKGYMRAYAKLLNIAPEPLLEFFNRLTIADRKVEKALWQGRRETKMKAKLVRWFSLIAVLLIIVAAAFWWQKNNSFTPPTKSTEEVVAKVPPKPKNDKQLTTLSKIQSMFAGQLESLESQRG